ncbi:MAG: hypothetical protein KBS51_02265 [Lachnospiraceae bacterium]|nr:hypothetical protein [Candidatus Darwinimomas equi]
MKKRILSVILAAALVVSLIPMTAFAETPESDTVISQEAEKTEETDQIEEATGSEAPSMLTGPVKLLAQNPGMNKSYDETKKTLTLSGTVTGNLTIPEDEDKPVDRVILSGVTTNSGVRIILKDKVTVEIQRETVNTIESIEADKALTFEGYGTLNLIYGILGNEDIIFNHSGSVTISDGVILSMKGNIELNAGIVTVHPYGKASDSQTVVAAAGIMALCGEVAENGATVNVDDGSIAQKLGSEFKTLDTETEINGRTISFKGAADQVINTEETDTDDEPEEFDPDSVDLNDGTWIEIINDLPDRGSSDINLPKGKGQVLTGLTGDAQTGEFEFYIRNYYKATYVYRDSDFRSPATVYNQKLALMSLNLAAAGFSDVKTEPEKSAHFLEDLFDKIGFSDVYINEDYKKESEANSMGIAIAHKNVRGQSVIAVVLRGGGYGREGSGNLNIGKVSEQAGWSIGRNKAIRELIKYMNEHGDEISGSPKFWITGYSRGAAVANMTANFMDCALDVASGEATVDSIVPDSDRVEKEKQLMRKMSDILKTNLVDYEDIYGYSFGTPAGAFECDDKDASGYPNHNDPDTNNIWSQANPEDPVSYVVPEYKLSFYRYGVTMDPRYADVPEEYDSVNILNQGEDVREKMLEQLRLIDEEMWRNMSDAPAFELRTTTVPDVLSLQFGFTEDENHKELTYPADQALIDPASANADVTDKEIFLDTMIKYVVDEVSGEKTTPPEVRAYFYDTYQAAFKDILYMMNDLNDDEKAEFFGELNEALKEECDIVTIIRLVSAIIDAEFLAKDDERKEAREEPKEILDELLEDVLDNAAGRLSSAKKLSDYCGMLKNYSKTLVDLLYNVVFDDLQKNRLTTLGTALYYGKSLVYSHYPQVAMAYMQAHDEDYVGNNNPIEYKSRGGDSTKTIFAGTVGCPVTDGKWIYDEPTGTWSYKTLYKFTDTWGYILNPSTGKPAWFFFDKNGKMLVGWQKLYWNGSWKWFYFSDGKGPGYGACQLGGVTPDGYVLNPDGSLKED